jgi:hypothetical protein
MGRHAANTFGRAISVIVLCASSLIFAPAPTAAAACSPLPTDKGQDALAINAPSAGTYRVWARVKPAAAAASSFLLQVDQTTCNVSVGGGTAIPAGSYTWVNYQNGSVSSLVDIPLTAGTHNVILAGQGASLTVDRLIFTTDTSCVPTGTGDNCATASGKPGDINGDGTVNVFDLSILLSKWGTSDPATDLNSDGTVNVFDLSILLSNWGT